MTQFRANYKAAETKTWLFEEKKGKNDTERVRQGKNRETGEDRDPRAFFLFSPTRASLFILYSICIVLQPGARVGPRERLDYKKKKSREGRGPEGNSRSQKIYFSPVQKPVFQAGTIDPVQKEMERDRQGQVGRGGGARGRGLWDGGER